MNLQHLGCWNHFEKLAEMLLNTFHREHILLILKIKKLLRIIKSKNLTAGVFVLAKAQIMIARMRRLIWGFTGCTYHIVEILMSRLKLSQETYHYYGDKVHKKETFLNVDICNALVTEHVLRKKKKS